MWTLKTRIMDSPVSSPPGSQNDFVKICNSNLMSQHSPILWLPISLRIKIKIFNMNWKVRDDLAQVSTCYSLVHSACVDLSVCGLHTAPFAHVGHPAGKSSESSSQSHLLLSLHIPTKSALP